MSIHLTAESVFGARKGGWVAEILMSRPAKKDGTANLARVARPVGIEIHRHLHGHVRVYKNGLLVAEQYV